MTYYDGLNVTFEALKSSTATPSARLVMLYLLQLNNRNGNSGSVEVSDEELHCLTGLSKSSVTDAKQRLKNMGLIDYATDRRKPRRVTHYEILCFTAGQKKYKKTAIKPRTSTEERTEDVPAAVAEWEKSPLFCGLDDELRGELLRLIEKHGEETIRRAMKAAKFANGSKSVNFNYFLYKLRELLKGESVKSTVARPSFEQPYVLYSVKGDKEEPVFDDAEAPWAKYLGGENNQAGESEQAYAIYKVKGEIADGENEEPVFDDRNAPWARYVGMGTAEGGRAGALRETASGVRGAIQAEGFKRLGSSGDRTGRGRQSGMLEVQRADLPQGGRDAPFETRYRHGGRAIEYHVCHLPG